jgi:hypothetical protein
MVQTPSSGYCISSLIYLRRRPFLQLSTFILILYPPISCSSHLLFLSSLVPLISSSSHLFFVFAFLSLPFPSLPLHSFFSPLLSPFLFPYLHTSATRALSSTMESRKPPKRPNLRWDKFKRQVLCCLFRFFVRSRKIFEEIFRYIFQKHLRERGISGFIPFQTMYAQWTWMRDTGHLDWSHVHMKTDFESSGYWREIIARIQSSAKALKLPLRAKTVDDIDTSRWNAGARSEDVSRDQMNSSVCNH